MTFGDVVLYCADNDEFVANVERLYGFHFARHPIERQIDTATGYDDVCCATFCAIVYDLVWSRLPQVETQERLLD